MNYNFETGLLDYRSENQISLPAQKINLKNRSFYRGDIWINDNSRNSDSLTFIFLLKSMDFKLVNKKPESKKIIKLGIDSTGKVHVMSYKDNCLVSNDSTSLRGMSLNNMTDFIEQVILKKLCGYFPKYNSSQKEILSIRQLSENCL